MKTKLILFIFAASALISSSCTKYPPTSDRLLEDLAVVTQYDTKVNFNNYKTYWIMPFITKVTDKDTTNLTNATATAVLNEIANNMNTRGFTKVDTITNADFMIQVVFYQNTYVYTYSYYPYYPYYWGGYYPYYPYYPTYYSSYTAGTANIELIDRKYPNTVNNTYAIRWNAYIRGLLTGNHTTAEITGSVDQAFTQTPQLATTHN